MQSDLESAVRIRKAMRARFTAEGGITPEKRQALKLFWDHVKDLTDDEMLAYDRLTGQSEE